MGDWRLEKNKRDKHPKHTHSWRDTWLKNSLGTKHVVFCTICAKIKNNDSNN